MCGWESRLFGRSGIARPDSPTTTTLGPFPCFVARRSSRDPLTNVLNPKLAVFFLSFLPQFIDPGGPAASQTVILSAVFIVMGVVWLGIYVVVIDLLSGVLSRPSVKRWADRIVGTVLAGPGLRLAASSAR